MSTKKILDKLQKIKALAESEAALGNEAAAQAFADALQKLLLTHKLQMTDLEFEVVEKEDPVERHFVDYHKYPDIKVRHTRVLWIERLASIVARAHFCRILVHPRSSHITIVGRGEDAAMAEYMFITLQRALHLLSKRATYAHLLKCKREGKDTGRGFRESYTQAFLMRLQQRFEEQQNSIMSTSTALVRVNRSEKAVEDYIEENFKKKANSLSTVTAFHSEGVRQGVNAADRVNLKANVVAKTEQPKAING